MSNDQKPGGDTKPQPQPQPNPASVPQQKDVPMPRPPIDGTHGIKPGDPWGRDIKRR
jgi:hypothetical protein